MSAAASLLEVSGLVVRYGAVTAVRGVDLTIGVGEIVSIVGPNGAGKTSLVSAIGVMELTMVGKVAIERSAVSIEIFAAIAVFYLALTSVLGGALRLIERRTATRF